MTNEVTTDVEEAAAAENSTVEQSESTEVRNETAETVSAAPSTAAESGTSEPAAETGGDDVGVSDDGTAAGISAPVSETVSTPDAAAEPVSAVSAPVPAPAEPATQPASETIADDAPASTEVDFGAILEQFEQEQTIYHQGELVDGQVVGITDRGVLVDFGYKSEGFVPVEEFTGPDGNLFVAVGDKVSVVIRTIHSGDSAPQLSYTDALARKVWDDAEYAFQTETPVTGRVVDKTKGGLRVDLNGIEAFLPGSQIDSRPIRGLDTYIGHDIEAKIIKFSRRRNNIVLSRKVLTDEVVNAEKAKTLSNIDIGYVVEGTIKNLTEYGAFVDIGGIDGLLHVTDMSWGRIHHPSDVFKVGEHIQVKVLKMDREKEKVSLGYKQLLADPWSTVVEVYPVDSKLKGIVSSVTDYGVFVELEPGVEGLVHVSEISWSRRAQSPKRIFHRGQEVEVQVLGVDTVDKRISLGMKQFQSNPWDTVDQRYPIGTKIHGRIRNLTDFGAFVELEEGIDGLVHVSDISWAKKIKHPKDVLKKDQEVDAIVTSIDKRNQRLSLSMKDLTPSAWESFVATHRTGDVVRGKVSRFTNFGIFVELGDGLEGLCHISELSEERVDRAETAAALGQEMDFKILRIEHGDQKIGLSHRAVGKDEAPVADTKMYSSEAKGGMASLGELANLKFGAAAEPADPEADAEERRKQKQAAKKQRTEEFAAREAASANEPAGDGDSQEDDSQPEPAAGDDSSAETSTDDAEASTDEVASEETPAATEETPAADSAVAEAPSQEETPAAAATEETPSEPVEETTASASTEESADESVEAPAEPVEETPAAASTEESPAAASIAEETPAETVEETSDVSPTEETPEAPVETQAAETASDVPEDAPEAETTTDEAAAAETTTEEAATDESPAETTPADDSGPAADDNVTAEPEAETTDKTAAQDETPVNASADDDSAEDAEKQTA